MLAHDSGKLRVAEALEELPKIAQALAEGVVNWSTVRELTRVAPEENAPSVLLRAALQTLSPAPAQAGS